MSSAEIDALRAAALPWLTSLDYCTMYDHPPALRVWIEADDAGVVRRAAFYRERSALIGLGKVVEFVGFPDIADDEAIGIASARGAKVATLLRMRSPGARVPASHGTVVQEFSHDVIAELPSSNDAYFDSLGKQKRQQLPRYWRRLCREFNDSVRIKIISGSDIQIEDILKLVAFNQSRMESQGKENRTVFESAKQQRRLPLTQSSGLLCAMYAGDRLLGGTFNYVHRDEAFLIVIAHDPVLEHLNIGNVCLWRTFEHLIERGLKRYHLFWGRKRYKTDFGGIDHPVSLSIVSASRWRARVWATRSAVLRQVPRAWRYARSIFHREKSAGRTEGSNETS